MKALVWQGTTDIRCESVPDPAIEHERDAIIKVTSCAICGSDLHLYDHFMPGMKAGDVMGHESMGEVVEIGAAARKSLKVGDSVVIPFTIICGDVSNAGGETSPFAKQRTATSILPLRRSGTRPLACLATHT
jgi:threonine dehydrogenase-like Zn-dependent dehydrogenase